MYFGGSHIKHVYYWFPLMFSGSELAVLAVYWTCMGRCMNMLVRLWNDPNWKSLLSLRCLIIPEETKTH